MKRLNYQKTIIVLLLAAASAIFGQDENVPQNSILKNFEPFDTPRTNCRPGTVYRIDPAGINYLVQDVSAIRSNTSDDGTLIGQMTFTHNDMLKMLNLNFSSEYITAEVEIQGVEREYTEQTNVDYVLWETEKAEELIVDPKSKYYLIREAVSSKNVTFRFDSPTVNSLVTGKENLKEKKARDGELIDFPFSIQKTFKNPKRLFYLKQEIGLEPYGAE